MKVGGRTFLEREEWKMERRRRKGLVADRIWEGLVIHEYKSGITNIQVIFIMVSGSLF